MKKKNTEVIESHRYWAYAVLGWRMPSSPCSSRLIATVVVAWLLQHRLPHWVKIDGNSESTIP